MVDYRPPINTTINSHSSIAQTGVSHTHDVACWCLCATALNVVLYARYLLSAWYMPGLCAREKAKSWRHFTCACVQNKASHTETREIVLSSPAENRTLRVCHALQRARIAPGPRPMCPDGLPMSGYYAFCRKVMVRRKKLGKSTKIRRRILRTTYT